MRKIIYALLWVWPVPAVASAQSLAQRITAVETGIVHLSFAARPGICGDGEHGIRVVDANDEWEADCQQQSARVSLKLQNRTIVAVHAYVGGRWRAGSDRHDLGSVRPQEAANYFISLAEQGGGLSGDMILPAVLADSVTIWPALLRLARAQRLPQETRRTAIFWLGQAAGDVAARALDSIANDGSGDREVRKQAVFALSQRGGDEGVSALLRIARSNPDPEVRKTALFWLGQSDDPRALDLFQEILR
jgi:hypothetical protein